MDFKTLRVDSHQSTIKCNVVVPAKYKAISRVVGSVFLIGHDVGRLQEFADSAGHTWHIWHRNDEGLGI